MKATFTFNPKHLALLYSFISADETRIVINGVFVELRMGKPAVFVATDGRIMGAIHSDYIHDATDHIGFIIPAAFLVLCENYDSPFNFDPLMSFDSETNKITAKIGAMEFCFEAIRGNYPNWREVIPAKPEPCCMEMDRTVFAPLLLMKAFDFMQEFVRGPVELYGRTGAPLVLCCPKALVVLMPGKADKPATLAPFGSN